MNQQLTRSTVELGQPRLRQPRLRQPRAADWSRWRSALHRYASRNQ